MTGMRIRDLMLAAGVVVLVVASISFQLSMAGQMMKSGGRGVATIAAVAD
ncbi:hypothetical protein GCM10019059_31750 [Camelimonas fluminis]|uniref:Uncharacterized protein n=1 Tax=Camelimonas fluminis TaxID=1576911 RepID=A0ABV7UI94_9HYPH|nr:hypothetical protein [Camelimonas fluminis]GHE69738.1 hypothetical protein GCM10019059_31750 [Camelimonas fluminis]